MEKLIFDAITDKLNEEGIKLVGVKFGEEDGVKTLFVTIDREEEPVDLDLCVKATNIVNPIIDELNLDIEDYVLDVSSKGEC
jgi:ribosome maturation factor RimP